MVVNICRLQTKRLFFQGILDVGMTQEDHVELIKTHTFMRKHATGTAKIELHVLHVERGNGSINKNKNYSFFLMKIVQNITYFITVKEAVFLLPM